MNWDLNHTKWIVMSVSCKKIVKFSVSEARTSFALFKMTKKEANTACATPSGEGGGVRLERKARNS